LLQVLFVNVRFILIGVFILISITK